MKITHNNVDSFIQNIPEDIKGVLIYGPDIGAVTTRARQLKKSIIDQENDPFCHTEISYNNVKDSAVLQDELSAMTLTGGKRIVELIEVSTTLTKEIREQIEKNQTTTLVLITAGDLSPTSSLRKHCEQSKNIAALPCYKDEAPAIIAIIKKQLDKYAISYDQQAIQYLSQSFKGDRLLIECEIEKIITYVFEKKHLSLEDAVKAIENSTENSYDELCNAVASKSAKLIHRNIEKLLTENIYPVTIVRIIINYFLKLQTAQNVKDNGYSETDSIKKIRPPIFFKQLPIFKKHLSHWNSSAIAKMLYALSNIEKELKSAKKPNELMFKRTMILLPLKRFT